MNLYFFDLDDTICNTKSIVDKYLKIKNIACEEDLSKEEYEEAGEYIRSFGFHNLEPLYNSTFSFLNEMIKTKKDDVYYITARDSGVRKQSIAWLKKYNLYLGEEKLIMDTQGIKGKVINDIMQQFQNKKFAWLFDDLEDNHREASRYKNIIACLPF